MRYGDPRLPARLWEKIVCQDDHWIWLGAIAGGPQIRWQIGGSSKTVSVRRILFEALHGPQSARSIGGCDRMCVNPAHAVAGTPQDVTAKWRELHPWIVCPHGHVLAEVGFYVTRYTNRQGLALVRRHCRACHSLHVLAKTRLQRAARARSLPPAKRRAYLKRSREMERRWREGERRCQDGAPAITARFEL